MIFILFFYFFADEKENIAKTDSKTFGSIFSKIEKLHKSGIFNFSDFNCFESFIIWNKL